MVFLDAGLFGFSLGSWMWAAANCSTAATKLRLPSGLVNSSIALFLDQGIYRKARKTTWEKDIGRGRSKRVLQAWPGGKGKKIGLKVETLARY